MPQGQEGGEQDGGEEGISTSHVGLASDYWNRNDRTGQVRIFGGIRTFP